MDEANPIGFPAHFCQPGSCLMFFGCCLPGGVSLWLLEKAWGCSSVLHPNDFGGVEAAIAALAALSVDEESQALGAV